MGLLFVYLFFYEGYTTSWLSLQTLVLIWWCRWCKRQLQISRESSKKLLWKCSFGKRRKTSIHWADAVQKTLGWVVSMQYTFHHPTHAVGHRLVLLQQTSLGHREVKNSENYGSAPRSIRISHCLHALQSLWFGSPFQRRTSEPILINCEPWAILSW